MRFAVICLALTWAVACDDGGGNSAPADAGRFDFGGQIDMSIKDMAVPDAAPDQAVDMAPPVDMAVDMTPPPADMAVDMAPPPTDMAVDMTPPPVDMAVDMTPPPVDMGACTPDSCPPDQVCGPDGACVARCEVGGCGLAAHCGIQGLCVEGPCVGDAACPADSYCADNGQCADGCRPDGCGDAQRCDLATRACVACAAEEICGNDVDEDCDDQVDDIDVCGCEPQDEVCDNRDNDCDGTIDEAFPQAGMPCPGGQGVCAGTGTWACERGAQVCVGFDAAAVPETCDGLDNDCDGTNDEGFDLGERCLVGVGLCAATGRTRCAANGATTECDVEPGQPVAEACNEADDDCDGSTDEAFPDVGQPCFAGQGVCRAEGVQVCDPAGGAVCNAVAGDPRVEICNGVDDDCDGNTDEGPNGQPIQAPCYTGPDGTEGVGLCRGGTATCEGGFLGACQGEVRPQADACDGFDNDCNGVADDAPGGCNCEPNESEPCYAGPDGTEGVGTCRGGLRTCLPDGSGWGECVGMVVPAAEICDGRDEDCNGIPDDAPGVGDGCTAGQGACAEQGVNICRNGAVVCDAIAGNPGVEACNDFDDDCDGQTDEGLGGAACSAGQGECAADGVMVCADGAMSCDAVAGQPAPEACNGIDDDCDGNNDEGFRTGEPCSRGVGECLTEGQIVCNPEGGVLCDAPDPVGVAEECNRLDDDCDGIIDEDTCIVDNGPPVVDLRASQLAGNPGTLVLLTVDAQDDVGVVACELYINGEPIQLDENCQVRYVFEEAGVKRMRGVARDAAGNEAFDDEVMRVFDAADADSPTVQFHAPRRGSDQNTPVPIVGTVDDPNLVEWEVTWGPAGDERANFLASGITNMAEAQLTILPAHEMPLGEAVMRLSAVDVNGRRRTTTRPVNIVACVAQAEACDGFDNDCDDAIDEGGFDCNDNNINDACELQDGALQDCDENTVPDVCDIADGRRRDCDQNGVPDLCEIEAGAADCDGDGIMDRCDDECDPDVTPPTLDLIVHDVDLAVNPNEPVRVTVLGDDDRGVTACELFVGDAAVELNVQCQADYVFPAPGFYTLRGVVRDRAGNSAEETVRVRVYDPNDFEIPVLAIASPIEGADVDIQTDVIGTIQDANLTGWRLTWGPVGQAELNLLAEEQGDGAFVAPVDNDFLALLDVEGVPNGEYELQLQAEDINFREQVLLHRFRVDICTPDGPEVCDERDNDCNGRVDDGPVDCDQNGFWDQCDIASNRVPDCNQNGVPDSCDIAGGLADCDRDGIPDVCNDACAVDDEAPIVDLFVGGEIVNAGTLVQIVVQAQDNVAVTECLATVNGEPLPLDAQCQAFYDFPNPGFVTVEGIARDAAGNQGVDSVQVRVLDPNDQDPPTIELFAPPPGAQLDGATQVRGTVQDPNLTFWASSWGPANAPDQNLIAQGDAEVINGPLGVIDAANIPEGDYTLLIVAEDVNGRGLALTSPFTVGVCEPAAEVCDYADNDCDRNTDEGFDGLGDACSNGLGICAREGITRCLADGSGTGCDAQPGQPEGQELCDNLDRDCDGNPTNGFNVGAPCTVGTGVCAREGVNQCNAAGDGVECSAAPGAPGNEICDRLDNDCDGNTDEGFQGFECGQGVCQRFLAFCPGEPEPQCDPFEGAQLEQCNGLDDDCDGVVDEDAAGTGDPCSRGVGVCATEGVETCVDAQIVCDAEVIEPGVEECNQLDDDCDGPVDEGDVCPDEEPPVININLSVERANPGEPVVIAVDAQDRSGIASIVITVDGVPLPVNDGEAVFQTDEPGVYTVEVTVTDNEGNQIVEQVSLRVIDAGDNAPPVVAIIRPTVDQLIKEKAEVEATIQDDNFYEYFIRLAPADTNDWLVIERAQQIPGDNILGVIDASLLENGLYRVQVVAEDVNGRLGADEVMVVIDGTAKIGLFSITYTDMSVPVAGMPLTVERTYDSRVKASRDFGYGWSLKIRQGKFEHNREQNEGWEFVPGGGFLNFPCEGGSVEDGAHTTELRVADRERYAFRLRTYNRGALQGGCQGFAEYDFVFGSIPGEATLQIIGDNTFIYLHGDQRLYTSDFSDDFTIDRVRLTTPDKRVFDFGKDANGIFRLEDRNANQVSIQSNGLIHSAGKSVEFRRDGAGRISEVVAPNGQRLTYAYDGRGDLVAVTDALGNVTRYTYDDRHNLVDIIDPSGNTPARQIYDEDGRLVAIEYSDGERLEMNHDPDNRVEVVRDRLANVEVFEYDENGNVLSHTDKNGFTTVNVFNDEDRPTRRVEPGDAVSTFEYDALGRMTRTTNPLGDARTAAYNALNRKTSETDFNGNETTHLYDADGNLLQTTDPLGNVWVFTYDERGNRITATDPEGNQTQFVYDPAGNLVREIDPLGNAAVYTYDANGNRITETRTRGEEEAQSTFSYDGNDRLIRTVDPLGGVISVEYDERGRKVAETDPRGFRTQYLFDDEGNNTGVVYPDGTRTDLAYDAEGRRIRMTDRNGATTRYEYDAMGRVVRTILADGGIIGVAYDGRGNVIRETDERGNETAHEYDLANRRTRSTDAAGRVTIYGYDANNNRTSQIGPDGQEWRYEFDAMNRQTAVIFPDGSRQETTYDAHGRKLSETDPNGLTVRWAYDAKGQLLSVIDPAGGETTYTYDAFGNRITQTDANGNTTMFAHDLLGRVISKTLPGGESMSAAYDAMGNMTERTDYNGATTRYTYDSNGRLTAIDLPEGDIERATWTPEGKRRTVTDARGVTTWTYDARGRVTGRTDPEGSMLQWDYDESGNRTLLVTPDGETRYVYDDLGRLTTVTAPDGGVTRYTYNAAGARESLTLPNGLVTTYAYDVNQRLVGVESRDSNGVLVAGYAYTLDAGGRRVALDEAHTGRRVEYTYDALSRLVEEEIIGERVITYSYDAVGNRLTRADSVDGQTAYGYDVNDRILTAGPVVYAHDANGNVTGIDDARFTFDSRNRIVLAERGGVTTSYDYDLDGHRIGQIVDDGDAVTETRFVVDENRQHAEVLAETDADGNTQVAYVYGAEVISQHRGPTARFYLADGQMSVRHLSDQAGAISDDYTYDAFGNLLEANGETDNPLLYNGQFLDANTGFYYLRARWMDPDTGRFQSQDPVEGKPQDPRTLHRYTYAFNSPVGMADPSGRFTMVSVSISLSINLNLRSIYTTNLVKTFLRVTRVAFCQLAPAYAARSAAFDAIASDAPGAWKLLSASQTMISAAFKAIGGAISQFYSDVANELVDFKFEIDVDLNAAIDALQSQLGPGFGGFNQGVDDVQDILSAIEQLEKWKEQVDSYLDTAKEWYNTAATLIDAGNTATACDKAKAWEKVGNKLIEFVPGF